MSIKTSLSLLLSLATFLLFPTITTSDNITLAFQKHTNFKTMSNLFIKTQLIEPISKYYTITILALTNKAITSITNKPEVELKNILMTHVILDYYDDLKLQGLVEKKSTMLTTLYQTTGLGEEMNGYMNMMKSNGRVYFGSGVKNSPLTSEYVKTVYQNPYNLSIIQISEPILAPGLSFDTYQSPPPPPHVRLAQSPSHMKDETASGSSVESPSHVKDGTASGSSDEDRLSDTPEADYPVDSPADSPADNEEIEVDDDEVGSSLACKASLSFDVILLLVLFATFVWF